MQANVPSVRLFGVRGPLAQGIGLLSGYRIMTRRGLGLLSWGAVCAHVHVMHLEGLGLGRVDSMSCMCVGRNRGCHANAGLAPGTARGKRCWM